MSGKSSHVTFYFSLQIKFFVPFRIEIKGRFGFLESSIISLPIPSPSCTLSIICILLLNHNAVSVSSNLFLEHSSLHLTLLNVFCQEKHGRIQHSGLWNMLSMNPNSFDSLTQALIYVFISIARSDRMSYQSNRPACLSIRIIL